MFLKRLLTICFLVMFLYLAFPPFAHAYLDPGTGSYIFQLLLAGLVGLAFVVKIYWSKIKALFTGSGSKDKKLNEDEDEEA